MSGLESYYNQEQDTYLIEIRLRNFHQLFNSLDPSPFLEKDLDEEAENYIIQSVQEFPLKTPLKLVFYLPQGEQEEAKQVIAEAIHNYFSYRREGAIKDLRHILQQGRASLVIGSIFLIICISLSGLVSLLHIGTVVNIIKEGLLILGWVAMWRPLQIFLYDWLPIYRKRQMFDKLSTIPIEIQPID
jgi:hypothetical protein